MTLEEYCEIIETKMKGSFFSVVVLQIIGSSKVPIHGYIITKSLDELTGGDLYIQAGTLYTILSVLESHGLIKHKMVKSIEGPPKKIYHITKNGRTALDRECVKIDSLFKAISIVRKTDWDKIHGKKRRNDLDK